MTDVQVQGRDGRQVPSVWQSDQIVPVCREFQIDIRDYRGRFVNEEPIPRSQGKVSDYINALMPGAKIEHLGRQTLLLQRGWKGYSTSNLLFQAAHEAFAGHHALALRPEVLMQIVLSQVAEVVKQNPEEYRSFFTTSTTEKQTIQIRHDGLSRGNPNSPWHEAIEQFYPALQGSVPSPILETMMCAFSTDTMEAELARLITFMDAASPYYDYRVMTMCGIPRVRLLGEVVDWTKLALTVQNLSRFFGGKLGSYFDVLIPVTTKLAEQAACEAQDDEFWGSIYKFRSMSGGDTMNGWLTSFVNYIQNDEENIVQKPDDAFDWKAEGSDWHLPGIPHNSVPSLVSSVPFVWDYLGKEIKMAFLGGVLGIDDLDGCLCPSLSYAVVEPSSN